MRSIAQIRQILKEKKIPNHQIFMMSVPVCSQKYKMILFFFFFISSMKPNFTKASYGSLPFQLHHKTGKDKP